MKVGSHSHSFFILTFTQLLTQAEGIVKSRLLQVTSRVTVSIVVSKDGVKTISMEKMV